MKNHYKLILFVCVLFFNNIYSQNQFDLGYKEYLFGDVNKAINILSNCINNKEELSKSYMYRGAAYMILNKFSESEKDLNLSMKIDSTNEKIYLYLGKLYVYTKKYKAAIKKYNIAISKNPNYAEAYDQRAATKGILGYNIDALIDSNKAIKIDSTNELFYNNRGFTKLRLKRFNEAIKDFDISLKLKPNQGAYANNGFVYFHLKKYTLAIKYFSKSIEFTPNDAEILFYRGNSYENLGNTDKACQDYYKSNSLTKNKAPSDGLIRIKCKK